MKKNFFIKITINLIAIAFIAFSLYFLIRSAKNIQHFQKQFVRFETEFNDKEIAEFYKKSIAENIPYLIYYLFALLFGLGTLIISNVKSLSFITSSALKSLHEHKESTKQARKEKKIEELERELEELKKDE